MPRNYDNPVFRQMSLDIIRTLHREEEGMPIHKVAKESGYYYGNTSRRVTELDETGIVNKKYAGKEKEVYLTDEGKELAKAIELLEPI